MPRIEIPGWAQSGRTTLWLPTKVAPLRGIVESQEGLLIPTPLEIPRAIMAFADEDACGLPSSSFEDLQTLATRLPFSETALATAQLAGALWDVRQDGPEQVEVLRTLLGSGDPLVERLAAFTGTPGHVAFCEQQLFVLLQLAILHSKDELPAWPVSYPSADDFFGALLGSGTLVAEETARHSAAKSFAEWLPFFVQNILYNAPLDFGRIIARAEALFRMMPARPRVRARGLATDIDAVLVDRSGFDFAEQRAIGLGLMSGTGFLVEGVPFSQRAHVSQTFFSGSRRFARRIDDVWALIAADRE